MKKCILFIGFFIICISGLFAQDIDLAKTSENQGRDPLVGEPGLKSRPSYAVDGSIEVNRDPRYRKMPVDSLLREVFVKTGACSSVNNITAKVYGWDAGIHSWVNKNSVLNRGLAYFHRANSDFPMEEGLLLTTGSTSEAEGPNAADHAATLDNGSRFKGDADLAGLVPGYTVQNVTVLEFDFIPTSSSMQFEYIFASEEYPKYVNASYNDVFGFFVTDKTNAISLGNIAMLPDGTTVSINNVNNGTWTDYEYKKRPTNKDTTSHHSQYFIPNPHNSLTTEFNGYTTVLTASIDGLTPCNTYHLKLALGNVGDEAMGSGVFLKANSFNIGNDMSVIVGGEEADGIFKNCDNNYIHLTRPSASIKQSQVVKLVYRGTAVNGRDYTDLNGQPLPEDVTFQVGEDHKDIWFQATNAAVAGTYFEVSLLCPCDRNVQGVHTVYIYENTLFADIIKEKPCGPDADGIITVISSGGSGTDVEYSKDGGLTWQTSNVFDNLPAGTYQIAVHTRLECTFATQEVELPYRPCIQYLPVNPESLFFIDN
jgi:hypothetical protein